MEDQKQPAESEAAVPDPRPKFTNPNLSATLSSDYEALRNDVAQANELASEYQRKLAGKSNEFASLKILFEKTQKDLAHLQSSILELRQERHQLANQAMHAVAYEAKCASFTEERDRLNAQILALQRGLDAAAEEVDRCARERESQIAWFTLQLQILKQQQAAARGVLGRPLPEKVPDPDARLVLSNLVNLLARLMGDAPPPSSSPPPANFAYSSKAQQEEAIDISFSS